MSITLGDLEGGKTNRRLARRWTLLASHSSVCNSWRSAHTPVVQDLKRAVRHIRASLRFADNWDTSDIVQLCARAGGKELAHAGLATNHWRRPQHYGGSR